MASYRSRIIEEGQITEKEMGDYCELHLSRMIAAAKIEKKKGTRPLRESLRRLGRKVDSILSSLLKKVKGIKLKFKR
jgi:hypothetical protein